MRLPRAAEFLEDRILLSATPVGDESRVNTFTAGTQQLPGNPSSSVAASGSGESVVVWQSAGQDGSGFGVYGQRYDTNGTPLGSEFRINTTTSRDQRRPSVALASDGSFVVTWESDRQDGSSWGIVARRYAANGAPVGGEFLVNQTTSSEQSSPSVVFLKDGSFVIAWNGRGNGDSAGVFARKFSNSGSPLGGEFLVNETTGGLQLTPSIAATSDGGFVIAWTGTGNGDLAGVFARQFNAAGSALGGEILVNETTFGLQFSPTVAATANGGFVVGWAGTGNGDLVGVFARQFSSSGTPQCGEILVNETTDWFHWTPSVTTISNGGFVVAWSGYGTGDTSGVFAREFDAVGTAVTGEFLVNTTTTGIQDFPSVASVGTHLIVTWSGRGTGDSSGVFLRRYQLEGLQANEPPVLNAIGNKAIGEGNLLTFTATASDPNLPGDTLTFSLDPGAPAGAAIHPTSGQFSWTPTEVDGPGMFEVTIRVTDTDGESDFETITVQVNEVNQAPVLEPVGTRIVRQGDTLTFTSSATDDDLPANTLTFSLDPGAPAGASIHPTTGEFSWTTSASDAHGDYQITIRVTDDGSSVLDDFETITVTIVEADPPVIAAALANDTGTFATDGVTNDPTVSGNVTDASPIAGFKAGLDATPVGSFFDIFTDLQPDGSFTLSGARLAEINGGPLADGAHTLLLMATDIHGNISSTFDLLFTLDTQEPVQPLFDLSAGSDSGAPGDQTTHAQIVTLLGQTDPNARLTLTPNGGLLLALTAGGTTALASNTGGFQFPNVTLVEGENSFTVTATDLAGNSSQFTRTILRDDSAATTDPVLGWNQTLLEAIRLDASTPPFASRAMAMVHTAIFDAVAAIEETPAFYVATSAPAGASIIAAVTSAAHHVLSYLYPAQQAFFDAELADWLAQVPNGSSETDGVALGEFVADAIIAIRSQDGWNDFVDYVPGSAPGEWRPTPPLYDVALLPQWADLTPFTMSSADQFRPEGPPELTSQEYADAFNEVKALGAATGSTRTAEQTEIARFWADGLGTYTPPGHWNLIAEQVAADQGNSISANARLFAMLNVALADAAIVAWDSKYAYEFWRPVTAIQQAATDGNDQTAAQTGWQSLLITPPFPEYVSGHSTFSGAAAQILAGLFGDSLAFTTHSVGLPGVQRSYSSFSEAAAEAGRSRIYGGIHFEFANQDGQSAGRALADLVLSRFNVSEDAQAPTILVQAPPQGLVTPDNITITGRVLDNLSGVETLHVQLDGGPLTPLAFDAQGRFSFAPVLLLDGTDDGPHIVRFAAVDATGNVTSPFDYQFTLDTQAPVIDVTSLADESELDVTSRLAGIADPTGSALISLSYAFDGGTPMPMVFDPATGAFDVALDLSKLAPGAHTLSVTARDAAGNTTTNSISVNLAERIPFTITAHTPLSGASDIGSTFRPQVYFSRAVDVSTLNANNFYATDTTGAKLPANIVPAKDGTFAWLFFTNPMPGASMITVHVDGSTILAVADGLALDGDGDGTAGGTYRYQFSTVSLVPLPGTSLSGKVVDPGVDLKPMTQDDFRAGPDGILHTSDDVFLNPLAGVKVFILGLEDQAVYTDANGNFHFDMVPSGNVKLAIDGRTATNAPAGYFFPEMVMELELEVGYANTVMGTMGSREDREANLDRTEVYLPRLDLAMLHDVSETEVTKVGADALSAPNLTPEQRQLLSLEIQPGSLIGPDGQPLANGQVGISTVPPELVRDMLPPGVLQHTFDITIQAPDAAVFNTPLQLTFPNVFNAAPGTKLNVLSFDHTTGRLVIEGTATVSEDGLSVVTDPGTGITKPGWHGVTPPGTQIISWPLPPRCVPISPINCQLLCQSAAMIFLADCETKFIEGLIACTAFIPIPQVYASCLTRVGLSLAFCKLVEEVALKACSDACASGRCRTPSGGASSPARPAIIAASATDAHLGEESEGTVADPIVVQIQAMMNELGGQIVALGTHIESVPQSIIDSIQTFLSSANELAGGSALDYLTRVIRDSEELFLTIGAAGGIPTEPLSGSLYYAAHIRGANGNKFEIRGKTTADGEYGFFVGNNQAVDSISFYDPNTDRIGLVFPYLSSSVKNVLPHATLTPVDSSLADSDVDGLVDVAEIVIGTDPREYSTAGDGISDFAKVRQGLNPLGNRPFATGVVASLPLQGEAKEVVVEGSILNGQQQTAYIATGSYGLAIVDASRFQQPIILSQLDLPGDATDVAVDARTGIAVVASGTGGLQLVDVSTATSPRLIQTIDVYATQVEIYDGVVYAGVSTGVRAYNLLTGKRLETLNLGNSQITALAREGSVMYALDSSGTLHTVDLSGPTMTKLGSLQLANWGTSLFVGNGVAYVPLSNPNNSTAQNGGLLTVDVTDPTQPTLISGPDATGIAGYDIALNGSGIALAVGQLGAAAGTRNDLQILDVSDPARTDSLLTVFTDFGSAVRFGTPRAVAIGSGIAYVASSDRGMTVLNYLPFDNRGQAPTVALTANAADVDSITPGIQVAEGTTIPLSVSVTDDVQVRNIELLVNGQVVQNDVSFPFELSAIALGSAADASRVTIQVRATDTGGNASLSNLIVLDLVPDTVAPTIVSTTPSSGALENPGLRTVVIAFSESLAAVSATTGTFSVRPTGETELTPLDFVLRQDGRVVQLTYDGLAGGTYEIVVNAPSVTDRAGNPLGDQEIVIPFSVQETVQNLWVGPTTGSQAWDNPSNWSRGVVPGATDDVVIDVSGTFTISMPTNVTIASLELGGISGTQTLIAGSSVAIAGPIHVGVNSILRVFPSTTLTYGKDFLVSGKLESPLAASSGAIIGSESLVVTATGVLQLTNANINADIVNEGTVTVAGTQISGSLVNRNNGTFEVIGLGTKTYGLIVNQGIVNAGLLRLQNGTNLEVTNGGLQNEAGGVLHTTSGFSFVPINAVIDNRGTVIVDGSMTITRDSATHTNLGTIHLQGGSLTLIQNGTTPSFNNSGTVQIDAGRRFTVSGGGNTFSHDGGTISGAGTLWLTNMVNNLSATIGVATLFVGGGTTNIPFDFINTGGTRISGSTLNGPGTITNAAGATFTLENAGVVNADLVNEGTLIATGNNNQLKGELTTVTGSTIKINGDPSLYFVPGVLTLESGFTNQGTLEFNHSASLTVNSGTLTNAVGGTIKAQTPGSSPQFESRTLNAQLDNQGTVIVDQQFTVSKASAAHTNSGTIQIQGGDLTVQQSGTAPSITNTGTIQIDAGRKLILTGGTFSQTAGGEIQLEIGGTTSALYGAITGSSASSLGGTLNLNLVNGFVPSEGNTFQVLTYASRTGTFATTNGTALPNGLVLVPTYNATDLTFTASQPLQVTSVPTSDSTVGSSLTVESATPVLDEALYRWREIAGTPTEPAVYQIQVADLGSTLLAVTSAGVITLDDDAAGYGWFIDSTPWDDVEFTSTTGSAVLVATDPNAKGRIDLLSVLTHEIGHLLGLVDQYQDADSDGIMHGYLEPGTRVRIEHDSLDLAFADWGLTAAQLDQT